MRVSDKGSKKYKLTEIKEKMEISRIRVGGFTTIITETDIKLREKLVRIKAILTIHRHNWSN